MVLDKVVNLTVTDADSLTIDSSTPLSGNLAYLHLKGKENEHAQKMKFKSTARGFIENPSADLVLKFENVRFSDSTRFG